MRQTYGVASPEGLNGSRPTLSDTARTTAPPSRKPLEMLPSGFGGRSTELSNPLPDIRGNDVQIHLFSLLRNLFVRERAASRQA